MRIFPIIVDDMTNSKFRDKLAIKHSFFSSLSKSDFILCSFPVPFTVGLLSS